MMQISLVVLIFMAVSSGQQECGNELSCTSEYGSTSTTSDVLETTEVNLPEEHTVITQNPDGKSEMTTVTQSTITTPSTAPTSTKPSHTVVSPPAAVRPGTICWCDLTSAACDINCCCDQDCSNNQKHIFTDCLDAKPAQDSRHCYSSDLLFRKPTSIHTTENNNLFCLHRDNLSSKKEFGEKPPIRTVEEFDAQIRSRRRTYPGRDLYEDKFKSELYHYHSTVWAVAMAKVHPFLISAPAYGPLCLTTKPIRYLEDSKTSCKLRLPRSQQSCANFLSGHVLRTTNFILLKSPLAINVSGIQDSLEDCVTMDTCIASSPVLCRETNEDSCTKFNVTDFLKWTACQHTGLKTVINIIHNGTEGIRHINVQLHTAGQRKLENQVYEMQMETHITFNWIGNENVTTFRRSGNPGYITGMPLLLGKKVTKMTNISTEMMKEMIEFNKDSGEWLTVLSHEDGFCFSKKRKYVPFNKNLITSCFFDINITYFSKNGCTELQKNIWELLLGNSLNWTATTFNAHLGAYGSSRMESVSDWVQILRDDVPNSITSTPTFQNLTLFLTCKNIVPELTINIAIAKFGPFHNPQTKIIGALFRPGPKKDITIQCVHDSCIKGRRKAKIKIISNVHFVDLTRPAKTEFAKPPGLEAKLPHDFFYPFLVAHGKACRATLSNAFTVSLICVLIVWNFQYT